MEQVYTVINNNSLQKSSYYSHIILFKKTCLEFSFKCGQRFTYRYTFLADKARVQIPVSFVSRRATFKDKLMHIIGDIVECVQSYERGPSDRHTSLIPK